MNTDKFDKHAKNNLAFYEGFLNISKYVVAVIIITLALWPISLSENKSEKGVAVKPHFLNFYNLMSRISADNVVLREEVGNLNCCIIIAIRTMYRISFNRLRK